MGGGVTIRLAGERPGVSVMARPCLPFLGGGGTYGDEGEPDRAVAVLSRDGEGDPHLGRDNPRSLGHSSCMCTNTFRLFLGIILSFNLPTTFFTFEVVCSSFTSSGGNRCICLRK